MKNNYHFLVHFVFLMGKCINLFHSMSISKSEMQMFTEKKNNSSVNELTVYKDFLRYFDIEFHDLFLDILTELVYWNTFLLENKVESNLYSKQTD